MHDWNWKPLAPRAIQQFMPMHGAADFGDQNKESTSKKPLYWVAPMDVNYRRDKPGKSPMDLVPGWRHPARAARPPVQIGRITRPKSGRFR